MITGKSGGIPDVIDTKYLLEGSGCLARVPELLKEANRERRPLIIVEDENTGKAAGEKLASFLSASGMSFTVCLLENDASGIVDASYGRVVEVREKIGGSFPLAVGGGTINDLVKRASGELGLKYLCVGTAASVDGYSSSGAAIVRDGYKATLECPPPFAVAADTDVLRAAPYAMTASGYADLYAKLAAGVDWMLADHLGTDKINRRAWDLVQGDLPRWVGEPAKLKAGDAAAFAGIFRGLIMSGFAMQACRDSRPASGAEHLVSHIWEMEHLSKDGIPVSHGFKVGVGTVLSTAMMTAFYRLPPEELSPGAVFARRAAKGMTLEKRLADARALFPAGIAATAEKVCREKWIEGDALAARLEKLVRSLPELKSFAEERVVSKEKAVADLSLAGCPVSPEEFGLDAARTRETVVKAQMLRKRYTVFDAIYECGLLDEMIEEISIFPN
jgi:glycerol-1-phosphate dehydrogenase [NAD(P)+]